MCREEVLFLKYLETKAEEEKAIASQGVSGELNRFPMRRWPVVDKPANVSTGSGTAVVAPLTASVWKFHVNIGDVIKDDDQRVVELEAMKTSVSHGLHNGNWY